MKQALLVVTNRMILTILKQEQIPDALFQELLDSELALDKDERSVPELIGGLYKGFLLRGYFRYLIHQIYMLRFGFVNKILRKEYIIISNETLKNKLIKEDLSKIRTIMHLRTMQDILSKTNGFFTYNDMQISQEEIVFFPNVVAKIAPTKEASDFWLKIQKQEEQFRAILALSPQAFETQLS